MKNTLPESVGITTPGLTGSVLFIILCFPIIYWIAAHKIQKLLEVQVVIAAATLLGIMVCQSQTHDGIHKLIIP
jgi:NCS1 family nucleobase:cation symporter-1